MNTHGKTVLVHKEGEEGSVELDRMTGQITTPIDERPDWADGLAVGLLAERQSFYRLRLGEKAAGEHLEPKAIAFQDLGWIGADAQGEEAEIEADPDYRADIVARVLGIDREDFETDAHFGKTLAEAELEMQSQRTQAEAKEIEEELAKGGFGGDQSSDKKEATG